MALEVVAGCRVAEAVGMVEDRSLEECREEGMCDTIRMPDKVAQVAVSEYGNDYEWVLIGVAVNSIGGLSFRSSLVGK